MHVKTTLPGPGRLPGLGIPEKCWGLHERYGMTRFSVASTGPGEGGQEISSTGQRVEWIPYFPPRRGEPKPFRFLWDFLSALLLRERGQEGSHFSPAKARPL